MKSEVSSLSFDEVSSNFTSKESLCAELHMDLEQISTNFLNPTDNTRNVYVILDAGHTIKLIRNSLENLSHLVGAEGKHIKWAY